MWSMTMGIRGLDNSSLSSSHSSPAAWILACQPYSLIRSTERLKPSGVGTILSCFQKLNRAPRTPASCSRREFLIADTVVDDSDAPIIGASA